MLRGNQLKRMRILKNITQQEVADEIDVKRNYISMLENEIREITQDKYDKWVEYLNSKKARDIRDARLERIKENKLK